MRTLKQGLMAMGDVYHASFTSYEVLVRIKMLLDCLHKKNIYILDCILVSFELSVYHMLGTTNMAIRLHPNLKLVFTKVPRENVLCCMIPKLLHVSFVVLKRLCL